MLLIHSGTQSGGGDGGACQWDQVLKFWDNASISPSHILRAFAAFYWPNMTGVPDLTLKYSPSQHMTTFLICSGM